MILEHAMYARDLIIRRPGITYDTFKQQCESLRFFLFFGICATLTGDLLLRPPRSSYWKRFSIFYWPQQLMYFFSKEPQSLFFTHNNKGSSTGWKAYIDSIHNKEIS